MFKRLNQQIGKNTVKTKQIQEKKPNAVTDTEQIVLNINPKTLAEVESETKKVITQAKLEAQEIIKSGDMDALDKAEKIMTAAWKKTEIIQIEAKQKTLQVLVENKKNGIIQIEAKQKAPQVLVENKKDSLPVQTQQETAKQVEKRKRLASLKASLKLDDQTQYSGRIELIIPPSTGLRVLSMFNDYLQGISELKVLMTVGTDQGTKLTVELDKPLQLMRVLSQIPGLEVTPVLLEKNNQVSEDMYSSLGGVKTGVRRIELNLEEA